MHMVFSGHKTEANHGQGMGVTSGEAGTLGGKTGRQKQAASEALKVCVCLSLSVCVRGCCAEDTGNRENKARRPPGNLGAGKAVFQDNSLSEAELRTRKGGKPGWRSRGRAREAEEHRAEGTTWEARETQSQGSL